jgi:hypothetical protein
MKKISLKQIRDVKTLEDLENLGLGEVYCDISYRGDGLGFYSSDIEEAFSIDCGLLPNKVGAGCNYLGGGLRGSIFASDFSEDIRGSKRKYLEAICDACVRVYENF